MAVLLSGVLGALVVLSLYMREVTTQNPGLQIRITERGVQRAAQVAIDLISSRLQNDPLPDFSDTSGNPDYWFSGLGIRSFQKPSTDVQVSPTLGITWNARNAALSINGNWRFKYKIGFVKLSDDGRISVSASGIHFTVSFTLGKSAAGKPTVRTTQCVVSIGSLDVDISGSPLSFIYNLFIRIGKGKIKDLAIKELCKAARKALDGDLNDELSDVKVMSTIANDFLLDYRLIRVPQFSNGHFDSYHKGEFRSKVSPVSFTSTPASFPIQTVTSRMVNIWGSDYVINSFAYATFKKGLLEHQISSSEIGSDVLRTTCPENAICLGKLFPQLNNQYPNGEGELSIKATSAPSVRTSPSGISLTLGGEISLQLRTPGGQVHPVLTLSLTLNMSVNVYLDGNVLRGSVTSFCPVVNVKETIINNIPANTFQALFDIFVKQIVVGSLDEIGLKGIDIPHIKNTQFSNIMLVQNTGSLMFAADVVWAPGSSNTPPKSTANRPQEKPSQPLTACYNPDLLTAPPTTTTTTPTTTTTTTTPPPTTTPQPPPPTTTTTPPTVPTERGPVIALQPSGPTERTLVTAPPPPGPTERRPVMAQPLPGPSEQGPGTASGTNSSLSSLNSSASQCTSTWVVLCFCAAILKTFCI